MTDQPHSSDAKFMALFTAFTALAKSLADSGSLDRNLWLKELHGSQQWLHRNDPEAAKAYDALMEMLTDL